LRYCPVENSVSKLTIQFLRDEAGATAIEYALIASFIAVAIVAAAKGIGTNLNSTFNNVAANVR
jgi:pilus assembly protein Flp/PilA